MAKVQISGDENIREALRRFKKMCDKEGIINNQNAWRISKNLRKENVVRKAGESKILKGHKN